MTGASVAVGIASAAGETAASGSAQNGSARLIHDAFAAHVRVNPDALAVVSGDERVSYAELDAASDAYAASLAARGVGPGQLVPVLMPRSTLLSATLLGVLKCGAAYAALDRRWPDERIRSVVGRLGSSLVVTDNATASRASDALGGNLGDVTIWQPPYERISDAARDPGADRRPAPPLDPSAAASVFFTSGTTGEPKGVVSPHRATTRLFAAGGRMEFGPGWVMPQAAPIPWDAFSLEIWGMLTTGGTSYVVEDDHLLPHTLEQAIASAGVNCAWLTASLFNLFVDVEPECFAGLRRLFIGGERLSQQHVRAFLDAHPTVELVNGYGPVESCVFATTHPISVADCDLPGGIPIGRPVPGTDVVLLNGDDPCAPDEPGEICIAGDGLATGYLGDPALTAEKFVTATVGGAPTRVYRTGDVGVRDAAGLLHFRGRTDRQVKIRGYRIELAEIESAAGALPGITRCAAVAVPGASGGYERLALFYTSDGLDPRAVRQQLADALPPHCVPDAVRAVDTMPTTANGKLDGSALLRSLDS